jgi:hypothetical protein
LSQALRSNAGMANREGDVDLRFTQVSAPVYNFGLAGLGDPTCWYVSNRQIHEDLGVPLFADHIRARTASFDSKLADVGNPLVRQLGRYLR